MPPFVTRRTVFKTLAAAPFLRAEENLPPVRAITKGPQYHWFGYYDKLQFDPTSRYVLGNEVLVQLVPLSVEFHTPEP